MNAAGCRPDDQWREKDVNLKGSSLQWLIKSSFKEFGSRLLIGRWWITGDQIECPNDGQISRDVETFDSKVHKRLFFVKNQATAKHSTRMIRAHTFSIIFGSKNLITIKKTSCCDTSQLKAGKKMKMSKRSGRSFDLKFEIFKLKMSCKPEPLFGEHTESRIQNRTHNCVQSDEIKFTCPIKSSCLQLSSSARQAGWFALVDRVCTIGLEFGRLTVWASHSLSFHLVRWLRTPCTTRATR